MKRCPHHRLFSHGRATFPEDAPYHSEGSHVSQHSLSCVGGEDKKADVFEFYSHRPVLGE